MTSDQPPVSLGSVSVAVRPLFEFDNSFVRDLKGLYEPWEAAPVPAPRLLALNEELATELGVDANALRAPDGVAVLVGNATPFGASPVAQAYAGHQFGGFSPRLGDGRALLLGAVLTRVAASHLRVGTFQYAAAHDDPTLVRRLADHAIARHYPHAVEAENPYLAFFEDVVDAQASLVARWMLVGFIHGVMNTDNTAISGETIDFGPCAFMDEFDPDTVFSSIDHGGRYAYGNQPQIAQWNLARLAETVLSLFDAEPDTAVAAATDVLQSFTDRYHGYLGNGMRAKLGLGDAQPGDGELIDDLLGLLHSQRVDFTSCFRALSSSLRGDATRARSLFVECSTFDMWAVRWRARLSSQTRDPQAIAQTMDQVNPVYIPRNHKVEEALSAASDGALGPLQRLLDVLAQPFDERPGLEPYAAPAPPSFGPYRTFCGT
jgi:uncharacterized protein YdiU (UPF0061 family)